MFATARLSHPTGRYGVMLMTQYFDLKMYTSLRFHLQSVGDKYQITEDEWKQHNSTIYSPYIPEDPFKEWGISWIELLLIPSSKKDLNPN